MNSSPFFRVHLETLFYVRTKVKPLLTWVFKYMPCGAPPCPVCTLFSAVLFSPSLKASMYLFDHLKVLYKYLSFSLTFTKVLKKFHFSGVFFGRFSLRIHRCQSESDQTYIHIFQATQKWLLLRNLLITRRKLRREIFALLMLPLKLSWIWR